jgi:predicted transcriptional regulator
MSTTTLTEPDRTAIDVPDALCSAESKLVYVFLAASDGATVAELHEALGLRKISLFPVLNTLAEYDVVARDGTRYVAAGA